MAGIAGSHPSSLAPIIPGADTQKQVEAIQSNTKPAAMADPQAAPQAPAMDQVPMPAPTPAPMDTAPVKPSLDDLMTQAQQAPAPQKPSLDSLFSAAESKHKEEKPWYDINLKTVAKGTVDHLPDLGMMVGGALGFVAGGGEALLAGPLAPIAAGVTAPAGAIAGAGLGKSAGEALKQAINAFTSDKQDGQTALQSMQKISEAAKSGMIDQTIGEGAGAALNKVPELLTFAASKTSGVSKMGIKIYSKAADKVNNFIDKYGYQLAGAPDDFKQGLQDTIKAAQTGYNKQIDTTLAEMGHKTVSISPIVDELDKMVAQSSKAAEKLQPEELSSINQLRMRLSSIANPNGMAPLTEVNEIKKILQDEATASYQATANGIPQAGKGSMYEKAAKKGAAMARQIIDKEAPSITEANAGLAEFHAIEEKLTASLLNQRSGDAAIVSAGRGANPKTVGDLQKLGELTGQNHLQDAQVYAAAKDFTGAGSGFKSAAVKGVIDLGQIPAPIIKKLGGDKAVEKLLTTPYGKAYLGQLMDRLASGSGVDKILKQFNKPIQVDNQPSK